MQKQMWPRKRNESAKVQFTEEEGRQIIYNWSERRTKKHAGLRQKWYSFRSHSLDTKVLIGFYHNISAMVVIQLILAATCTILCQKFNIIMDMQATLFVSPLVFPLSFLINADYQRREKVLEELANLKASMIMYYYLSREWRCCTELDELFSNSVANKIKQLLVHIREYLLTTKAVRRSFIVKVIYEDVSDLSQLTERLRVSLANSGPLIARILSHVHAMSLAFEKLQIIREYRSPRSIRSFTKVLIFALPLLMAPLYVSMGEKIPGMSNWAPVYVSILVSFVFACLQGVQDTLDDPFDGISEDDVNLWQLDDWLCYSVDHTAHRSYYKIGRFTVTTDKVEPKAEKAASVIADLNISPKSSFPADLDYNPVGMRLSFAEQRKASSSRKLSIAPESGMSHPYASLLSGLASNTTILPGGLVKPPLPPVQESSSITTGSETAGTSFFRRPSVPVASTKLSDIFLAPRNTAADRCLKRPAFETDFGVLPDLEDSLGPVESMPLLLRCGKARSDLALHRPYQLAVSDNDVNHAGVRLSETTLSLCNISTNNSSTTANAEQRPVLTEDSEPAAFGGVPTVKFSVKTFNLPDVNANVSKQEA